MRKIDRILCVNWVTTGKVHGGEIDVKTSCTDTEKQELWVELWLSKDLFPITDEEGNNLHTQYFTSTGGQSKCSLDEVRPLQ